MSCWAASPASPKASTGDDREVVGPDLFEVERSLRAARRRLSALEAGLGEQPAGG